MRPSVGCAGGQARDSTFGTCNLFGQSYNQIALSRVVEGVAMRNLTLLILLSFLSLHAPAQQESTPQPSPSDRDKKAPQVQTPAARLRSAKNVFLVRVRGGDIPYDTIRTTIDGWGRFAFVNAPDKADLIIEVSSVGGNSDVRVTGGMNPSSQSSRDLSPTEVTMIVTDARNKRILWRGTESAKYAMRQKARENNLVEAAEKLASKFHDRLEPLMAR
jgi:hypothetical protein